MWSGTSGLRKACALRGNVIQYAIHPRLAKNPRRKSGKPTGKKTKMESRGRLGPVLTAAYLRRRWPDSAVWACRGPFCKVAPKGKQWWGWSCSWRCLSNGVKTPQPLAICWPDVHAVCLRRCGLCGGSACRAPTVSQNALQGRPKRGL